MPECRHKNLILLQESSDKLRCKVCHLTIAAEELGDTYCPECFEGSGQKHYEFEKLERRSSATSRYRCEDCGIVFDTE